MSFKDQQIEVIKKCVRKSNKNYTDDTQKWRNMFRKSPRHRLQEFARRLKELSIQKGFTPMHYVLDLCNLYNDHHNWFEFFKNIFDIEEGKNPTDDLGKCGCGISL